MLIGFFEGIQFLVNVDCMSYALEWRNCCRPHWHFIWSYAVSSFRVTAVSMLWLHSFLYPIRAIKAEHRGQKFELGTINNQNHLPTVTYFTVIITILRMCLLAYEEIMQTNEKTILDNGNPHHSDRHQPSLNCPIQHWLALQVVEDGNVMP